MTTHHTPQASWGDDVRVLARALDQAGDVLDQVHRDVLDRPTPCADWDVAALADHLVATPPNFLAMAHGEQPDWSAPPHVTEEWGPAFRVAGDDLIHWWHEHGGETESTADMATSELAVHTWDLARAIGFPVERLDPQVATRALEFLRSGLTPDNRGGVFGPEQQAAADAGPYVRLAAFAGRSTG
ncbi:MULTISPECIES: TIGR03086 family metal-binding protein [unclassified Nocardioides]|uniref:TIGR03086 family metal-binding protein n=1 Tax=unclassified Nocardioides TaxID=2615069 RepID=UPI0000EB61A8|nr:MULTISPECIES: TIGR03086 family metal-binding protein [unclassified Nocardioides]ABL80898.1 conserved hypothetical protein [Nocardioides sp. JS614]